MTRVQTLRRIVLPQAMRVIIPPTGNETISMLKTTSLASVITVTGLLYLQQIFAVNYKTIQLLIVASISVHRVHQSVAVCRTALSLSACGQWLLARGEPRRQFLSMEALDVSA